MPSAKPPRGRPKGTGLDDRALLQSVIRLVEANPQIKPTTAIRSVGVTDPSAIRRLRDKYHLTKDQSAASSISRPAARAVALKSASEPVRSIAVTAKAVERRRAPEATQPAVETAPLAAPAQKKEEPASWLYMWAELGLRTMAASFDVQLIIYEEVLRSPQVTAAIGSRVALCGFADIWCATSPASSRRVH